MDSTIVVALISAIGVLLGTVIRVVTAARREETLRHSRLEADVTTIMAGNDAHSVAAAEIAADLKRHMVDMAAANAVNQEAHQTLFTKIGRIEGWIEGRGDK